MFRIALLTCLITPFCWMKSYSTVRVDTIRLPVCNCSSMDAEDVTVNNQGGDMNDLRFVFKSSDSSVCNFKVGFNLSPIIGENHRNRARRIRLEYNFIWPRLRTSKCRQPDFNNFSRARANIFNFHNELSYLTIINWGDTMKIKRNVCPQLLNRGLFCFSESGLTYSDRVSSRLVRPPSKPSSEGCLLYTSPSPRDGLLSRMPSSA